MRTADDVDAHDDDIGAIYRHVDLLCTMGKFADVDALLRKIDVQNSPIVLLLAWLTITLAPKDELTERAVFFQRVREHLQQVAPDRFRKLLMGLE